MKKAYWFVIPILALWLVGWIVFSWAAIQDDALIHLRYAQNLLHTHQITYDGVHSNYGTSSLLYVYLLAGLSALFTSPNLPRAVSSLAHILLVGATAFVLIKFVPARATLARLLGLVLLYLLVTPSAVRWFDDGMETGLGLCFVIALCLAVFLQSASPATSIKAYLGITTLVFFMVLLRTEFSFLCAIGFAILLAGDLLPGPFRHSRSDWLQSIRRASHLPLGAALAYAFILFKMHTLLSDTAVAKSDRIWFQVPANAIVVIAGGMSLGVGVVALWLLSLIFAYSSGRRTAQTIIANLVFPITLLLATLRGQEIQGIRYLLWTFLFSLLWNVLELGRSASEPIANRRPYQLIATLISLLLVALPFESRAMGNALLARSQTLKAFESDHLEVLEWQHGIAFDVGYIGYFTHANICDLAGLVNGRAAARLTRWQRAEACAESHPAFLFLKADQLYSLKSLLNVDDWDVCTQYDFINLRSPEIHYLMLPAVSASQTCRQISPSSNTYPAARLLQ